MKTIQKIPFRAVIESETKKIINAMHYANYSGFWAFFVYTNIVLYFFYMIHLIYF